MSRILDIEGAEYNGVWRFWKLGSLGLFAAFVAILFDVSRTLRAIEKERRHPAPVSMTGRAEETPFAAPSTPDARLRSA